MGNLELSVIFNSMNS